MPERAGEKVVSRLEISRHLPSQPAGFVHETLVHPDLSGRRPLRLFHDRLEFLTSPNFTIGLPRAEEDVHERFVVPFEPRRIPGRQHGTSAIFGRDGGISGTDGSPEGADPLLWELGQLRKVAQGALAHAAKVRNLSATASLLRASNGLLDLLAKIEQKKAEELKAKEAVASLPPAEVRESLKRKIAAHAERLRQAQAVQQPPAETPTLPETPTPPTSSGKVH